MITTIELICEKCGKLFSRTKSEHNRNQKKDRKVFCGLKCTGNINKIPVDKRNTGVAHMKSNNRLDEYSPFRAYLKVAKMRNKECNVDLKYLKDLWEEQKGMCPLTGWNLKYNPTLLYKLPFTPDRASLDRIDSAKGYCKGNVRYVAAAVQFAKHIWSDKDVINFAEAVVKNQKTSISST